MHQGKVEQVGTPQEVFEHPANAFVMDFLGNVNVFHGRVRNGRAVLGGVEIAYPEYPHDEERAAAMYVRPHELEIVRQVNGSGGWEAKVLHVNAAGSVARVQLWAVEFATAIQVEVTPERLAELGLQAGDQVWLSPRRVRVFTGAEAQPASAPDYSI
jgi:sulfate transport system ATP-binding protein